MRFTCLSGVNEALPDPNFTLYEVWIGQGGLGVGPTLSVESRKSGTVYSKMLPEIGSQRSKLVLVRL